MIVILVFTTVFSVLVSDLSSSFATEKRIVSKKIFFNTLNTLFFIIIPLVVFISLNKEDILKLLYLRGNLDNVGIDKILAPFFWETLYLVSFIIYIIPTALYLAKKEYKLITKIGTPIYILGILLNLFFTRMFGYVGISIVNFTIHLAYGVILMLYS